MRYPSLTASKLEQLVGIMLGGGEPSLATEIDWIGSGPEVDLISLDRFASECEVEIARRASGTNRDSAEGILAGRLYDVLKDLPIEVLDEPGWWRYLSVRLWSFISWRESEAIASGEYRKFRRYVDGGSPAECVPMRMYLRGRIACESGNHSLASAVQRGTDLWRSHILRVRTGSAPALARALVREQVENRMPTTELREVASRVNRLWSNVVLNLYSDDEARDLVRELRQVKA